MPPTKVFLSQAEFARQRGVSRKTVTEWKNKGLIVVDPDLGVDVEASEQRLADRPVVNFAKPVSTPIRSTEPVESAPAEEKDQSEPPRSESAPSGQRENAAYIAGVDLTSHRARLARSKADEAELELARRRGELIPAEEVESAWLELTGRMRARLLAIPTKIAPIIVTARGPQEAQDILRRAVEEALAELAVDVPSPGAPTREEDGAGVPGAAAASHDLAMGGQGAFSLV